jgi:putative lipoic acid-binding regulatory protein
MTPQDEAKREQLRKQLNETHTWPCVFKFKFIMPAKPENEAALRAIFGQKADFKIRESAKGNYRAVTVDEEVHGPDDIFARYEAASTIPGMLSL